MYADAWGREEMKTAYISEDEKMKDEQLKILYNYHIKRRKRHEWHRDEDEAQVKELKTYCERDRNFWSHICENVRWSTRQRINEDDIHHLGWEDKYGQPEVLSHHHIKHHNRRHAKHQWCISVSIPLLKNSLSSSQDHVNYQWCEVFLQESSNRGFLRAVQSNSSHTWDALIYQRLYKVLDVTSQRNQWRQFSLSMGWDLLLPMTRTPSSRFAFLLQPRAYAPEPVPSLEEWWHFWETWGLVTTKMISRDVLMKRPIPLRNPLLFYLGHIPPL